MLLYAHVSSILVAVDLKKYFFLSNREFTGRLASVDKMLSFLESPGSEPMLDMLCVYRLIVVSTRAELALLLGDVAEATRLVEAAIQLAPVPSIYRMRSHVFYWGLALTLSV